MTAGGVPELTSVLGAFRARAESEAQLLDDLVEVLRAALGRPAVRVGRRGLFGNRRYVRVAVTIGNQSFEASRASNVLACSISEASGGISIGTSTQVPWSAWISQLAAALGAG